MADGFSRIHSIVENGNKVNEQIRVLIKKLSDVKEKTPGLYILGELHILTGHAGPKVFRKSVEEIIPKSVRITAGELEYIARECLLCQRNKHFNVKHGKTSGIILSDKPLDLLSSDNCGPYKVINSGKIIKVYIITILTYAHVSALSDWSNLLTQAL